MGFENNLDVMKNLIKNGHLPMRYNAEYPKLLAESCNCFFHACFNFSNKQLEEIANGKRISPVLMLPKKPVSKDDTTTYLLNVADLAGLKVDATKMQNSQNLEANQWLIAFYYTKQYFRFSEEKFVGDFHVVLQEKTGEWSSKIGFTPSLELCPDFKETIETFYSTYYHYENYVITNPYAKQH